MRHLISLKEQDKNDILEMLHIAKNLKKKRAAGERTPILQDKTLIMLFEKTSTRTRLSFEAAMTELGGHAIFLDKRTSQFALTSFEDEIQAVLRFGHALVYRSIKAKNVETTANFDQIPVIDACSEKYHPCQALSDMLTMVEEKGSVEDISKVAWLGIENNVSNTLMLACVKLGIEFVIIAPERDEGSVDEELNRIADETGLVRRTADISALEGADFVHTDTWMNMEFFMDGTVKSEFREEYNRRNNVFGPYQLSKKLIDTHCPDAKIMHCMPLHIGYEITRGAVDSENSIIFTQAENRLHMQKAILVWLLESGSNI